MLVRSKPRGFTLVELLTVIAIIALLIGVLVPSLSAARTAARKSTGRAQIDAIAKGAEMFNADFGYYPVSRGSSPFHPGPSRFGAIGGGPAPGAPVVEGAQWAAIQLSGVDLNGFVDPTSSGNDVEKPDGRINDKDWKEWYSLDADRPYARKGPYVDATQGKNTSSLNRLITEGVIVAHDPDLLADASGQDGWATGDLPLYVDPWRRPLLYYRANLGAKQAYTTGDDNNLAIGIYDQSDNAGLTGSDGANGQFARAMEPVQFSGAKAFSAYDPDADKHAMGNFDYDPTGPDARKLAKGTFEWWMTDVKIFESTRRGEEGKIVPYRPDAFILVSAGPDGLYGSDDDLWNFER